MAVHRSLEKHRCNKLPFSLKIFQLLKLLECRYRIVTQQLNIETLNKARAPGGATWTNIVNKMNCKFYGWNYIAKPEPGMERLNLDTGRILVVGISASKPSRASAYELFKMREQQIDDDSYDPTVVGVSMILLVGYKCLQSCLNRCSINCTKQVTNMSLLQAYF